MHLFHNKTEVYWFSMSDSVGIEGNMDFRESAHKSLWPTFLNGSIHDLKRLLIRSRDSDKLNTD